MAGRMKWMWLVAGAAMVGAAAFAAQGGFVGNGGGEERPMVQLPPAAPAAKASTSAASAPAAASLSATVGGYTYDRTALQAAIDADTEVDNGYFIVGNASDPDYLFAYESWHRDARRSDAAAACLLDDGRDKEGCQTQTCAVDDVGL